MLESHQKKYNNHCLSSLASYLHSIGDNRVVTNLVNCIEESLTLQTDKSRNIIHFDCYIMKNRIHIKGEQRLRYNMRIWNKNGAFDILNRLSEHVMLVQLMDILGNVNHAISIVGN